ncbi:hypothetical protein A3K34_01405 [candidate division WWE3 bacterium RIFOXYC1_FULL_40_10]|uniref:phenylalanine--tRNA ligase n=1 Tax=candidate division WWE3 bacterium RIFOXYA2_FULL_46_9 TaxID=1802636 RepID=A0A1F4W2C9_UNCKA|nr:MAG: hypothetical protein A3K58_01405 [candidate division WWE3 bacterium RIFOXYB1_FULL_40_22]OGC61526.1 MAG: hypothetical protein A3K37_01405 [candidate division WWE3 bacterium RIFOXYA1_FULL_40_11]OGC63574.1 MAG: hypothetical protein A2264_04345 [candidate division WWE3 bacterium RIFOXYA2_FULL_46_9]OGC64795.1 MAG: hypothetical protein A2326_02050 [candidate division WWE3 bacterium RIFOXYB2_FULL_41_6]OGC65909.1 MAG: hypothetical protein A3K34_01405 [candidate division WWE3 bacterium RIFOXYC1_
MPLSLEDIKLLEKQFLADLKESSLLGEFDELYLKYFSKNHGTITKLMKLVPELSAEEKRKVAAELNKVSEKIKAQIETAREQATLESIGDPMIDLSYLLPPQKTGMMHPTETVIRELDKFFRYYGFSVVDGQEIEEAEFNFRKLNLPEGHPATDLQDTLFISEPDILMRTHTSSIESRVLTQYDPPIRAVASGKVYRNETASQTNTPFFHHYQGFVVDKGITIQHLKGTLTELHKFLFGDDVVLRFRYKYYPEVSPGMGTDMLCKFCKGAGCSVCKGRGWIESLGSGMIHYNTLKACGIDPDVYTGYAFGLGLDRLVMQKFGLDDIRKFYGGGIVFR